MTGSKARSPIPRDFSVDRLETAGRDRIVARIESAIPVVAPAVSLAIWHGGAPIFEAGFGWLDPEEQSKAVHTDTLFDLASLTKLFTSTVLLSLVSAGRIALDDAVVGVIPEFGDGGSRTIDGGQEPLSRRSMPVPPERRGWTIDPTAVTFRQLLTHTSGMAPWRSVFEVADGIPPAPDIVDPVGTEDRWRTGLRAVFDYPFVARPGTETNYSDLGFIVLAEAIGRLGARPLDEAIRERISIPLGLRNISVRPLVAGVSRGRIAPTSLDEMWRRRRCWGEVEDENAAALGGLSGHAGLFGSARDAATFGQAWLESDARLAIDASIHREATVDQTPGMRSSRGLGWQVRGHGAPYLEPLGAGAYGHSGFTGTSLVIDPTHDLVVSMLTNRVYAGRTNPGIDELRREVHAACVEAMP